MHLDGLRDNGVHGLAGTVVATLTLAQAATTPWLGRLADRHGQRRLLLGTLAAHAAGILLLVLAAQLSAPAWTLFPAAALAGAAVAPMGSLVRARWAGLVDAPGGTPGGAPELETAFAFQAVLDEAVFVVGPVVVTALAVGVTPAAGLIGPLVLVAVGSLALAAQRGTEPALFPVPGHRGRSLCSRSASYRSCRRASPWGLSSASWTWGSSRSRGRGTPPGRRGRCSPSRPSVACWPASPAAPAVGGPRRIAVFWRRRWCWAPARC